MSQPGRARCVKRGHVNQLTQFDRHAHEAGNHASTRQGRIRRHRTDPPEHHRGPQRVANHVPGDRAEGCSARVDEETDGDGAERKQYKRRPMAQSHDEFPRQARRHCSIVGVARARTTTDDCPVSHQRAASLAALGNAREQPSSEQRRRA